MVITWYCSGSCIVVMLGNYADVLMPFYDLFLWPFFEGFFFDEYCTSKRVKAMNEALFDSHDLLQL